MKKILECKKICKKFGKKQVVEDLSFDIESGDILAFIGPNGSGKTTTIKLMLGLQSIDRGEVIINGYNVTKDFVPAIEKVGAIVENPDLYMYLTGYQNLKIVASSYKNIDKKRIDEVVQIVGLENRINDKVSKYSLGMRQRLGIARALINYPNILILDEPTNGLDPEGIKDLRDLLKKLAKEGMGILISSHNLAELESLCNKVVVISNGKLIDSDKVENFKKGEDKYFFKVSSTKKIKLKDINILNDTMFNCLAREEEVAKIVETLVKEKISVYEVKKIELTLEEAFLKRTGGNEIV